jgi:hypothetical protein
MKLARTLVFITAMALLISACNKGTDETTVTVKANTNPLLAHVPADTAYVFAVLEPSPKEITDAYISRFQPVLDVMSEQIKQFRVDYDAGEFQDNQIARFASAVLDELGGSLTSENLEKLGISMQVHSTLYAMGVFPVLRLELSNAQETRNAIARIEAKMGVEMAVKELNGTSYWRVMDDHEPIGIYISIFDQQLAVSAFPVDAEDRLLAAFLGQEMPGQSMASNNALAIMNSKKGYTGYGSGILDFEKFADEILNPESATYSFLGPEIDFDPMSLDAVCVAEIRSIVAKAPRMTVGTTVLTANEISMRYELEIENSLANGLASLVSDIPPAADGDHLFSGSLALQIGKLRNFLLEKANAIVAAPYQCEKLQQLNQQSQELVTQLNLPMPPMINNLLGARVRLDDFNPAGGIPDGKGLVAIHVDKPEMFIGMASMFVPGFDKLDIANQDKPVRIPTEIHRMENLDVFAMMSDKAIGAAVGEQYSTDLGEFMTAKSQGNGTFFSASYDMAKQMEIETALPETYDFNHADEHSPADEFSRAVRESYTNMFDRSRVDMRFTKEGLVIDSSITFK